MTEGLNLLDWIFACGQAIAVASLVYFLYLVVKYWRELRISRSETAQLSAQGAGREEGATARLAESGDASPERDRHDTGAGTTGMDDDRVVHDVF